MINTIDNSDALLYCIRNSEKFLITQRERRKRARERERERERREKNTLEYLSLLIDKLN